MFIHSLSGIPEKIRNPGLKRSRSLTRLGWHSHLQSSNKFGRVSSSHHDYLNHVGDLVLLLPLCDRCWKSLSFTCWIFWQLSSHFWSSYHRIFWHPFIDFSSSYYRICWHLTIVYLDGCSPLAGDFLLQRKRKIGRLCERCLIVRLSKRAE